MTPPDDASAVVRTAFDELGRLSLAEHSLGSILSKVTEVSTRVLPGEPFTSVTIVLSGRPRTAASSGDVALDLDELQYQLASGPCLTAAVEGRRAEIPDTRNPTEWPEFAAAAAARGCDSVLSFPLPAQERVAGALNVYARQTGTSARRTLELVSRFAAYAVVPVSNMFLYESAVERAEHLQAALDSRAVIDQAKGILMERFKLTADDAFRLLARVSMESNTKVRDVARRFVETGEFPPP